MIYKDSLHLADCFLSKKDLFLPMSTPAFDIPDRPDRRKTFYSSEERAVIDVYKKEYLEATSAAARKHIAQTQIFPDLFNYWAQKEMVDPDDTQTRAKVFIFSIDI